MTMPAPSTVHFGCMTTIGLKGRSRNCYGITCAVQVRTATPPDVSSHGSRIGFMASSWRRIFVAEALESARNFISVIRPDIASRKP